MSFDFRASQVRTNKLITSGSTGTPASLLIYDISADGSPANQGNVDNGAFATSSIGADAFIYVSGSRSALSQSSGGVVIFGGDVRTSGSFQAITETSDDSFYQPPHVLVNSNTGGVGSIGDGGLFLSSVGMLGISGGTQFAGGIELSIRNSQTLSDGYFPSQSQIVIRNQSAGGIFLNSDGQWGAGGISIGAGTIDSYNLANGEVFIYTERSYLSMSALEHVHIQAGTDESSTVKFYTFGIGPAIDLTDINNTAVTASLANTTIVGAINELKVSASLAAGGGGGGGGGTVFPSRAQVGNYAVVTQSNSQTVGGNYIVASEHQSSSIELRTILSTTNSGNRAHLRLFSITDGYYLPIGGAGIFELSTTSTTPTVLTSSNLNAIVTSSILLEVQVSGTLTAGSLVITHHNSDLIFTD